MSIILGMGMSTRRMSAMQMNRREYVMLKMNFKSLMGALVVASLLVGCQTAQKNNYADIDTSFLDIPSDYGSDLKGGSRGLASGGSPLGELFKLLESQGGQGKKEVAAAIEQINKNKAKNAEIDALKSSKKGKIAKEDIGSLSSELQAQLVDDLMKLPRFRTRMTTMAEYEKVYKDAEAILKKGSKTGVEDVKAANTFKGSGLLSSGSKEKVYSDEVMQKYYLKNLVADRIAKNPEIYGSGVPGADEAKAVLVGNAKKAYEYHKITGKSMLTVEACELPATEGKQFGKLLDEHIKVAEDAKKRGGKICPELEAWVAASFQEKLGRTGASAWVAAEELSFCKFEKSETGVAAREMNTRYKGRVPASAPDCP